MIEIDSSQNTRFKLLKKLKEKKYRQRENKLLIEGPVVLEEIKGLGILEALFIEKGREEDLRKNFPRLFEWIGPIFILTRELFKQLQDTNNSQGIIGLGQNPIKKFEESHLRGRFLYTDGIQDPGNMGGLIRSCEAFSFNGIILGPNCVDPTNPKVVRASMASFFRLDILEITDENLETILQNGQSLFVLDLNGKESFEAAKTKEDFILVVGNEANGPRSYICSLAKEVFTIPLSEHVNSLNANVAASIAMYELKGGRVI